MWYCDAANAAYEPEGDRIVFTGNGVRTEPNAISAIGLTLHDLATNATKYGALSNETSTVEVTWSHARDKLGRNALRIEWVETGGPAIDEEPANGGTGFDIAETLLSHSRGTLERKWPREGFQAIITVPVGK